MDTGKRKILQYNLENINLAVEAVVEKKVASIREAARYFNVPRATIHDRLSGKVKANRSGKIGAPTILTWEEELLLEKWITKSAIIGLGRKREDVLDTVQKIIKDEKRKTPFKDDRPGNNWYYRFLKRHPKIKSREAESITMSRAYVTEKSIRDWFLELKRYLENIGCAELLLNPKRIFNGDETSFSLAPKTGKVLAPVNIKNVLNIQKGNEKEMLTVLFIFNAEGTITPPLVVFPYKRQPPNHIIKSVPNDWGIGTSESGWMKSDVFFEHIANSFNTWLIEKNIEKPILLLLDGHTSHLSLELSQFTEKNGIILYALPPNATHILQPADVSLFKPLKSYWKTAVRNFTLCNETFKTVNKSNFCPILLNCLNDNKFTKTIQNGFRKCGIYPFTADAVDYSKCLRDTLKSTTTTATPNTSMEAVSADVSNHEIEAALKVVNILRENLISEGINVNLLNKWIKKIIPKANQSNASDITYYEPTPNLSLNTNNIGDTFIIEMIHTLENENGESLSLQYDIVEENNMMNSEAEKIPEKIKIAAEASQILSKTHIAPDTETYVNPACEILPKLSIPDITTTHANTNDVKIPIPDNSTTFANTYNDKILQLPESNTLKSFMNTPEDANSNLLESDCDYRKNDTFTRDETLPNILSVVNIPKDQYITNKVQTVLSNVNQNIETEFSERVSPAFKNHLLFPKIINDDKILKKKKVAIPRAISSAQFQKYIAEKEEIKKIKKENQLEKKNLRLKKIEEQQKEKEEKRNTKQKNTTTKRKLKIETKLVNNANKKIKKKAVCSGCQDELDSDAEEDSYKNLGCDICPRWFHLQCTQFSDKTYEEAKFLYFKCSKCQNLC